MSKFARGRSWIEHRLADEMRLDDAPYRVELVARRATGVQGFRVSVVFMPLDTGDEREIALPNAGTPTDVHKLARELQEDEGALGKLFHRGAPA